MSAGLGIKALRAIATRIFALLAISIPLQGLAGTSYIYDELGRVVQATHTDGAVTYNASGQRVKKTSPTGATYYVYDEAGDLLGVYDSTGNLIEEIVWLDDVPVATIRTSPTGGIGFFYIHTDHLNAPVRLTRVEDNEVMWRWDHDPYGAGATEDDADGNGAVVFFNLRFPGQYYDVETSLHYNFFRDYDPVVGRYIESDPIGLNGGLNTYAYVSGYPLTAVDPFGLDGSGMLGRAAIRGGMTAILDGPEPGPMDLVGAFVFFGSMVYEVCAEPDCGEELKKIYELMDEINRRINELLEDRCDQFTHARYSPNSRYVDAGCRGTSYEGHKQIIRNKQRELSKWISRALRKGCPVPPGAIELATRGLNWAPRGWYPGRSKPGMLM